MKHFFKLVSIFYFFTFLFSASVFANTTPIKFESQGSKLSMGLGSLPICWMFDSGCSTIVSGNSNSTNLENGGFNASFNTVWLNHSTSNGDHGWCAPTTGTVILTDSKNQTLYMNFSGSMCDTGGAFSFHHTLNGSFVITGGTGNYFLASGNGSFTSDDESGLSYEAKGTLILNQ